MSNPEPGRVLVVGAGALGARIVRQLHHEVGELRVHDRRAKTAEGLAGALGTPVVAVDEPDVERCDVVVLASPRPQSHLAARALRAGASVVCTSDDLLDLRSILTLDAEARAAGRTVVAGAATVPGLSGLLVRHLVDRLDEADEAHVAVHGTGGPACARQHHRALAGLAVGWHDGQWIRRAAGSGRELCWFPEPIGPRDCYRAELAEPMLLHRAVPQLERISARMSANRRDRFTAWMPMLSPPHREGGLGAMRVEVRGRRGIERVTHVVGVAERTAIIAAAVAASFAAGAVQQRLPRGVVVAGDADLPTGELLEDVRRRGVHLSEFVGADE